MKTTTQRRSAAIALGGISLAVTLAGCASGAGASDTSSDSTESSDSSTSESTTTDTAATYTDGDYSATGSYESPGGAETIEVEITLAGDIVTAVTVTSNATNLNSVRFQGEFVDGIAAEPFGEMADSRRVGTDDLAQL